MAHLTCKLLDPGEKQNHHPDDSLSFSLSLKEKEEEEEVEEEEEEEEERVEAGSATLDVSTVDSVHLNSCRYVYPLPRSEGAAGFAE